MESVERAGNSHIQFSANIKSHVDCSLAQLTNELSSSKHTQKVAVMKHLKNKNAQMAAVQKSKEKYFARCTEKNAIVNTRPTSGMPKEIEKHDSKVKKARESEMQADEEYSANVTKLKAIHSGWRQQMASSCEEFQKLEEKRLQSIQSNVVLFTEFEAVHLKERLEASNAIEKYFRAIDIESDIQEFIVSKGTGNDIPAPLPYINYYTDAPMEPIKGSSFNSVQSGPISRQSSITSMKKSPTAVITDSYPTENIKKLSIEECIPSPVSNEPSCVAGGPAVLFHVRTLYSYEAQGDEELGFEANETIHVTSTDENPWWLGQLDNGKSGLFPSNFVEKL